MLNGYCQLRISSNRQHDHDLPPALDAEEAALLACEAPLCDDDSVDSAELPVPVVLPAVVSAGVEEPVAVVPAVATPVGVLPLV